MNNFTFILPYIDHASINFRRKLIKLFKSMNVDIKVVFTSTKVSSYFSLKCKTALHLRTNLVYRYNCLDDPNVFYIGKTKRFFGTRYVEHIERDKKSAIYLHLNKCNKCKQSDLLNNFEIIDKANNDYELKILEALHISKSQPILNKQIFKSGASYILKVF